MSDLKSHFDEMALTYDKTALLQFTSQETDFVVEELDLPIGSSILDIGCGTGRHSIELAKRGYSVTGIDISEKMLDIARAKAAEEKVKIDWIIDDARGFKSKKKFDGAISFSGGAFGVSEPTADAIQSDLTLIRSIYSNLNNQAKLIVQVINAASILRQVTDQEITSGEFDFQNMVFYGERCYVPAEIDLFFRRNGFKVLHFWPGDTGKWRRQNLSILDDLMLVVAHKE